MLWGQKSRVTPPMAFSEVQPHPPTLPHLVQARLVTREGEVEPKFQALTAHRDLIQEFR